MKFFSSLVSMFRAAIFFWTSPCDRSMRASEVNRLHKILDDDGIKLGAVVSDINGVSAREMVAGLISGASIDALLDKARGRLKLKRDDLREALDSDLSARIHSLEHQLAEIDAYFLAAMEPYAFAHRLLQTIPGIDQIASALILIETGTDMGQFGSAQRLASWASLSPGNNESAGKRKSGRTGRSNGVIRYILCECANAARNTKSSLAAKYRSLKVRKSHKKAIVALAHKMIRVIYVMLTRQEAYHDPQTDYAAISAKKNAPRWIKQLRDIGKWSDVKRPATAST